MAGFPKTRQKSGYASLCRWLSKPRFPKPTFVHTDQGAEYTSQDYTDLVKNFGVTVSMSAKASPRRTATRAFTTTLRLI
ncbi:MAG: DDE-type integrase/transposase/recombinase [Pseudomonadales bacterium]|nr:DDE-type integrase/transposase/recombinase [Pseudomonadales bacterium]